MRTAEETLIRKHLYMLRRRLRFLRRRIEELQLSGEHPDADEAAAIEWALAQIAPKQTQSNAPVLRRSETNGIKTKGHTPMTTKRTEKQIGDFTVRVEPDESLNGPYKVVVYGGPNPRTLAARFDSESSAVEYLDHVSSRTLMEHK